MRPLPLRVDFDSAPGPTQAGFTCFAGVGGYDPVRKLGWAWPPNYGTLDRGVPTSPTVNSPDFFRDAAIGNNGFHFKVGDLSPGGTYEIRLYFFDADPAHWCNGSYQVRDEVGGTTKTVSVSNGGPATACVTLTANDAGEVVWSAWNVSGFAAVNGFELADPGSLPAALN